MNLNEFSDKHIEEAAKAGLKLLRNCITDSNYKIYECSCGNELRAQPTQVRRHPISCKKCTISKYNNEASNAGFTHICLSDETGYSYYECKNGHICKFQRTHVRNKMCECKECYEDCLIEKAKSVGFELLGKSSLGSSYRVYKKSCGCIEDMKTQNVAKYKKQNERSKLVCSSCYEKKLSDALISLDIEIIDNVSSGKSFIRFNKCGHIKTVFNTSIIDKSILCRDCQEERYKDVCNSFGLIYNGPSKSGNSSHRNITLPCGCNRDIHISSMLRNVWSCFNCGDNHLTNKSNLYLVALKTQDGLSWLKLGYAKHLETRFKGYKFAGSIDLLKQVSFETGLDCMRKEMKLHAKYSKSALDSEDMKKYMQSGYSECYPMNMLEVLTEELNKIEKEFNID